MSRHVLWHLQANTMILLAHVSKLLDNYGFLSWSPHDPYWPTLYSDAMLSHGLLATGRLCIFLDSAVPSTPWGWSSQLTAHWRTWEGCCGR